MNSQESLARKIDQTRLNATLTAKEVDQVCQESRELNFKAVCLPPIWMKRATEALLGSSTLPITVVGFPLGYHSLDAKRAETEKALRDGAKEIDLVMNLSLFKSGVRMLVLEEMERIKMVCGELPLKVIIETAYLDENEKRDAAKMVLDSGADFLKTSTGFATGVPFTGAQIEDIILFRQILPLKVKIKASGGVRTAEFAQELIRAGADRLGTSSGKTLLEGGIVAPSSY